MKKTVFAILAVALIAFAAVAGCVTTPAEEPEPASPVGEWIHQGKEIVSFNPDGTVTAVVGNVYKGFYEETNDSLVIKDLMAITNMIVSDEEKAFIETFESADGFKEVNGNLILTAGDEEILIFRSALIGTWETKDGCSITFNKDNSFGVRTAINGITGTYEFTKDGIDFTIGVHTMAGGSDKDEAAEEAFLDALRATTDFMRIGNKLTLLDADGKELITLTAKPIGKWVSGEVTLELEKDGTVTIVAGNTYKGTYAFENHVITLKDLEPITKMIPSDEEKAFIEKLESAGYNLKVNQFLTAYSLTSADEPLKVVLVFTYA